MTYVMQQEIRWHLLHLSLGNHFLLREKKQKQEKNLKWQLSRVSKLCRLQELHCDNSHIYSKACVETQLVYV